MTTQSEIDDIAAALLKSRSNEEFNAVLLAVVAVKSLARIAEALENRDTQIEVSDVPTRLDMQAIIDAIKRHHHTHG